MVRLIIIAGLFIFSSAFAANLTEMRAGLLRQLACISAVQSGLSEERLVAALQLSTLDEKLTTIVRIFGLDSTSKAIGESVPELYSRMAKTAEVIVDPKSKVSMITVQAEMRSYKTTVSRALVVEDPDAEFVPRFSAEGKRAMETRQFGDDWSDLDRFTLPEPAVPTKPSVPTYTPDYKWGEDFGDGTQPWNRHTRTPQP